jgi:hypothetical protein
MPLTCPVTAVLPLLPLPSAQLAELTTIITTRRR